MKRVSFCWRSSGSPSTRRRRGRRRRPTPTEKQLLKDVATLKTQVKTLQTQQTTMTQTINTVELAWRRRPLHRLQRRARRGRAPGHLAGGRPALGRAPQAGKTCFGPQTPITATLQGQDVCAAGGVSALAGAAADRRGLPGAPRAASIRTA